MQKVRSMPGNSSQIGCIATGPAEFNHILTTGCRSGEIINFDVRARKPIVSKVSLATKEQSNKINSLSNMNKKLLA